MKATAPLALSSLAVLVLAGGCAGGPDADRSATRVEVVDRPRSALTALVRALEVVHAISDPEAEIRVRAVECDSLIDRQRQVEYVRIVLGATVLSDQYGKAREVLHELERALESEARATARLDTIVRDRLERVFWRMDWSATPTLPGFELDDLVSVSDTIRIEVRPADPVPALPDASHSLEGSQAMRDYVRSLAEDPQVGIGPVRTDVRVLRPAPGVRDVRYHVRPADEMAAFTRDQIGQFLFGLEARSPAVTVTRVVVLPAAPASDVIGDLWRFEADLNVRIRDA